MAPIQVTVVTGTSIKDGGRVVESLLRSEGMQRMAAIVPKRGKRSKRASRQTAVLPTTERLVRLGEGCACCTIRGDIRAKVRRLATEQGVDHIVIQTAPTGDLSVLAKTFTVPDGAGTTLLDVARIERMVTVIDVPDAWASMWTPAARGLISRVEMANVLWLDQASEVPSDRLAQLVLVLESINPRARIVQGNLQDVSLSELKVSEAFDLNVAQRRSALASVLDGELASSGVVSRWVYRERRPFHPVRLRAFIDAGWPGLVRAHGGFWVASRPDLVATLDVAGGSWQSKVGGMWWASIDEDRRPTTPEFRARMASDWHADFGDRNQEIAIVGLGLDEDALRAALDRCLLTEDELSQPQTWSSFPHPFAWPEISA
jgi:G3E family GTPase